MYYVVIELVHSLPYIAGNETTYTLYYVVINMIHTLNIPQLYKCKLMYVCRGYIHQLSFIFHLKLRHIEMYLRGHMTVDTFFYVYI